MGDLGLGGGEGSFINDFTSGGLCGGGTGGLMTSLTGSEGGATFGTSLRHTLMDGVDPLLEPNLNVSLGIMWLFLSL